MENQPSCYMALTRVPELYAVMMNMKVFLDDKEIGELPYATRQIFPLEPGNHKLYVRLEMNYQRSRPVSIAVSEGGTVELNCGTRFSGIRSIFNLFLPNSLIIREGAVNLENVPENPENKL